MFEGQFTPGTKRGGDGVIAVSYEARAKGIKRGQHRFLRDAQKLCPELHVFTVEEKYGKACLNLYREASKKTVDIMRRFCPTMERASIDECYLDLTEHATKYPAPTQMSDLRILIYILLNAKLVCFIHRLWNIAYFLSNRKELLVIRS